MTDGERVGKLLREARKRARLSLDDASRAAGWSAAKLSRIERGLLPLTVDDLSAIAAVYGRSANSFMRRAEASA